MRRNRKQQREIEPLIMVTAEECGGNAEKMVRKFSKKVKKEGLMEELRSRRHFVKPTVIRAEKKRQKKRLIQKVNKKRDELFTARDSYKRRRR